MIDIKTFRHLALSIPDAMELFHVDSTSFGVNKKYLQHVIRKANE